MNVEMMEWHYMNEQYNINRFKSKEAIQPVNKNTNGICCRCCISTMIRKQNVPVYNGEMKETMTITSTMREPNTHVILTPMIFY